MLKIYSHPFVSSLLFGVFVQFELLKRSNDFERKIEPLCVIIMHKK